MFSTMRAAAPRNGSGCSPSRSGAVVGASGAAGSVLIPTLCGAGAGGAGGAAGAAGAAAAAAPPLPFGADHRGW